MNLRWILDHLWVIIAVAAVIARIFMKAKGQDEEATGGQLPKKEYEFEDPELAERTRKIREEIQRKIAERTRQQTPGNRPVRSAGELPPPLPSTLPEIFREVVKPIAASATPPPVRRAATMNMAEEAERQAALMEKLTEAKQMKEAALKRAAFEASITDQEPVKLQQARTVVLDDLRSPQALRRAFVLREVLGPPVALR